MDASNLSGIDETLNFIAEISAPIEVVFPIDARYAGMSQDIGVALFHLPVGREPIAFMSFLRAPVFIGPVTGIVILSKGNRLLFPGKFIRVVANQSQAASKTVKPVIPTLIVTQGEGGAEI